MPYLLSTFREHQVSKELTLKSTVPVQGVQYRAEGLQARLW
jgi:hypothetical protein